MRIGDYLRHVAPAVVLSGLLVLAVRPAAGVVYTTIDEPNATRTTYATGVSGNNIVGWWQDNAGTHGFLYNGNTWTSFDDPSATPSDPITEPDGINGNNIYGTFYTVGGNGQGFIYNGTTWTTLNDPAGVNGTFITGMSSSSVIGTYKDAKNVTHGFIYDNGAFTTVDDPSTGSGMNSGFTGIWGNTMVGSYEDATGFHGFTYNGTSWTTLNAPVGSGTFVEGIYDSDIVGYYQAVNGNAGFLFDGSTWKTLADPKQVFLTQAEAISGETVVGIYDGPNANFNSFKALVPEPASLSMCVLGGAAMLLRRKRRRAL